jgi:hypothetical protein
VLRRFSFPFHCGPSLCLSCLTRSHSLSTSSVLRYRIQVKQFADTHPEWRDGPKKQVNGLSGAGYLAVASERLVNPEEAIIPLRYSILTIHSLYTHYAIIPLRYSIHHTLTIHSLCNHPAQRDGRVRGLTADGSAGRARISFMRSS